MIVMIGKHVGPLTSTKWFDRLMTYICSLQIMSVMVQVCVRLDLVISPVRGSVLTDVSVESLLTDHHVIMCKLVTAKPRPVRKEIFYRKYASIDMKHFTRDLIDSPLVTSPADDIDS